MSFPPSAFLIGAQKAGTTYLAGLLDQSPGIALSRPKEPHYFTANWWRGTDWYRSCFPAAASGRVLLDASPSYAAAPLHASAAEASGSPRAGVPERMAELVPGARLIYVLRDPVERIHSAYWHDVRSGDERRPLRDAVESEPAYINMSDYLGQAREYLRVFPRQRILFLRFEDLCNDPAATAARCLEFLGVDDGPAQQSGRGRRHAGYRPGVALRWLRGAGRTVPAVGRIQEAVWARTPPTWRRAVKGALSRPVPTLEPDDREWLAQRFSGDRLALEQLTGLDLGAWSGTADAAGRVDRSDVAMGR